MANVVLATDDLTVLGGPASVNVNLDIGATGERGTLIFVGNGKPDVSISLPTGYTTKILDMYINILSSDDEYMYLYQYVNTGISNEWVKLMKLTPNQYSVNSNTTFVDGVAEINLPLSAVVPSYPELLANITAENFNVQATVPNLKPISSGVIVGEIIVDPVTSTQVLPISITAMEFTAEPGTSPILGTWSNITGEKVVYLYITVV